MSEEQAQEEDDAVSAEEVDSSYDEDDVGTDSSESEGEDPNDEDYDPNDDAPATVEDEGFYAYVNLVKDDDIIYLVSEGDMY